MKDLKIVFTKSKKFFPIMGWLIMLWTRKPYSHVARAIQIRDWGERFYHAAEGKVNYEYEKFFHKKNKVVKEYVLEIPESLDRAIKKQCYEQAGNKYGYIQNIGIVITDIYFKIFRKKTENPWKKGVNCSEILYTECFKVMFSSLDYDPDKIKPHQIEEIILDKFKKDESTGKWVLKS
jgi:hypothetical protein